MKIRSDFVTNSSSSSFLFDREITTEELQKEVMKNIKEYYRELCPEVSKTCIRCTDRECDIAAKVAEHLFVKKPEEYDYEELEEVFLWYEKDILVRLCAQQPKEVALWSADAKEKLFTNVILNIVVRNELLSKEEGMLCFEFLSDEIYERLWCWVTDIRDSYSLKCYDYLEGEGIVEFYEYYEKIKRENRTFYVMVEKYLDVKYMFYRDYSFGLYNLEVWHAVDRIEGCRLACTHMG